MLQTFKVVIFGLALSAGAGGANAEPVLVGGDTNYDACPVVAVVDGLDPNGDNYLAVRDGPRATSRMLDKVFSGNRVYVCSNSGNWRGIVYGEGKCGVSSPVPKRRAYRGPCRAGWVHRAFVREVAG